MEKETSQHVWHCYSCNKNFNDIPIKEDEYTAHVTCPYCGKVIYVKTWK